MSGLKRVDGEGAAFEWERVDTALRRIARQRGALDAAEARLLREAVQVKIWRELGCVSLTDYLERRLGYAPRTAQDRVRVALALADLPAIEAAMSSGLPHSAVRELTRVATPETEQEWLDSIRGKNVHEIERMVAGRGKGSRPGDRPHPDLMGKTLPLEAIRPPTLALFRDARRKAQAERGGVLDDDTFLAMLCAAFLEGGGAAEPTRARYQVAVTLCEHCGAGWQEGGGRKHDLPKADIERALCDAQHVGVLSGDPARAVQDVAPRTRRFVYRRDGGACRAPGCRSRRHLELHHLTPQAEGGGHEPENLILLCDGCHVAHHRGLLTISGTASDLVVERTRPLGYEVDGEAVVTPDLTAVESSAHVGAGVMERATLRADANAALVSVGFGRPAVAVAVDLAIAQLGSHATLEDVLRTTLRSFAPSSVSRVDDS